MSLALKGLSGLRLQTRFGMMPLWQQFCGVFGKSLSLRPLPSTWEGGTLTTAFSTPLANPPAWQEALWLAVPKRKVTKHRKRLKTTLRKRIKIRQDIVTDPRTGETTLRHKMPFNWKDYLPGAE